MTSTEELKQPLVERLENLEVRMAYLEHMLGELDSVIRQTADELVNVRVVVEALRKQAEVESGETKHLGLEAEKPPHY